MNFFSSYVWNFPLQMSTPHRLAMFSVHQPWQITPAETGNLHYVSWHWAEQAGIGTHQQGSSKGLSANGGGRRSRHRFMCMLFVWNRLPFAKRTMHKQPLFGEKPEEDLGSWLLVFSLEESDSLAPRFCFGVCFSRCLIKTHLSLSMCSSPGMVNFKYIAFWHGWLSHRS